VFGLLAMAVVEWLAKRRGRRPRVDQQGD